MKPQSKPFATVADLQQELRQLRAHVQRLTPPPQKSGAQFVRELGGDDPRVKWDAALDDERTSKREVGMRKAAQLLAENGDAYPRDGHGTRALAEHAGIGLDDAKQVFTAHLQHLDELRGRHEDAERTHLTERAKQFAPQFVRVAVRQGIDVAAGKLAEKAGVSLSIARQALEEHADGLDA
jgi:hypothetical protein